jgi:hypothetical protein
VEMDFGAWMGMRLGGWGGLGEGVGWIRLDWIRVRRWVWL